MSKPTFNNKENEYHHSKEDGRGRHHSRSSAIVAHIILIDDNEDVFYLIGKRGPKGDQPNKYNVPCGYFDWNEDLRGAVSREVHEETDFDLSQDWGKVLHSSLDQPWFVNTSPKQNRQNISFHAGLVIRLPKGAELPKLSLDNMEPDEAVLASWMPIKMLESIPAEDWAFNHDKRIADFVEYLNGQEKEKQQRMAGLFGMGFGV